MSTISHNLRFVAVLVATFALAGCVGGFFAPPKIAHATVPGVNGKIAYESHDGSDYEIYTIDASGGTPFNVTNSYAAHEEVPNYSPEGTKIAYSGWDGNDYEIYTIDAAGGTPSQLTNDTENDDSNPSYSPDGTR